MLGLGGNFLFRCWRKCLIGFAVSFCALVSLVVFLPNASAQDLNAQATGNTAAPKPAPLLSTPVPLAVALETRGDLSLQDATIQKALFTIGVSWRVNIVVGKEVQGTVSCIYKQTPLREVLDAILLANGYSYRAVGESLVVQKAQEVGSANPLFESATISITHGDLNEIMDGARLLLSQQGQIRPIPSARSMLVVDFTDRVASIRNFVTRMDTAAEQSTGGIPSESYNRLQVAYFRTQYIPVENTREPITAVLSTAGRVATMSTENRLVVVDYASNIAMVHKVLAKIDRPVPQVRITALIYDISLQDVEQLGLNWNSVGKGNNLDANGDPQQSFTFDTTTLVPFTAGTPGGTATIQSLTRNFDITAVALLLQNANDARLLANPNVTVMENETADMSSVQQIPFQQITQSELGGQLGTTAFKDVGVTLQVTPTVAVDGTIKLVVEQEFSRVAGFTENDNQPIIDTRIANTTVRVANGRTLVIGGLRQRSDTGNFNGIPLLKDIRFIGPLFRSRETTVRESELIVFLMPEVVGYQHAPSHREYKAQETVNCRLDRIPMAEGCGPDGKDCSTDFGVDISYEVPPASPTYDADGHLFTPTIPAKSAPGSEAAPAFRQNFGDRYRAPGATDEARRVILESAPPAAPAPPAGPATKSTSVKDDSRNLLDLMRAR